MGKNNPFVKAEGKRVQITNAQTKQIKKLYKDALEDIKKERMAIVGRTNISSVMRSIYLSELQTQINQRIIELDKDVEKVIRSNMINVTDAVLTDNERMLSKMGFSTSIKNLYISRDIVNQVASGKLYEGKWSLSNAIWSDTEKKLDDINTIIAKGIAMQKSTYDIAKDLEKYVDPKARKDWQWSKVYPGTNKVVDYNAQRLARTMVSHAYQESFVRSTKDNPFIEAYRWLASGIEGRMCAICEDRDGKTFAKDELPLDHPNGMCTFEIVMEKNYEQIGKSLADWINDEGDENLNRQIDNFANNLYGRGYFNSGSSKATKISLVNDKIKNLANKTIKGKDYSGATKFSEIKMAFKSKANGLPKNEKEFWEKGLLRANIKEQTDATKTSMYDAKNDVILLRKDDTVSSLAHELIHSMDLGSIEEEMKIFGIDAFVVSMSSYIDAKIFGNLVDEQDALSNTLGIAFDMNNNAIGNKEENNIKLRNFLDAISSSEGKGVVSDIIGLITNNTIEAVYEYGYHEKDYIRGEPIVAVGTLLDMEFIANYGQLRFMQDYETIEELRKIAPNRTKYAEEAYEKAIKFSKK